MQSPPKTRKTKQLLTIIFLGSKKHLHRWIQ